MLAFVRSPKTWFAAGEIYVKQLPDGEPVQLTNDSFTKDGSGLFAGRHTHRIYRGGLAAQLGYLGCTRAEAESRNSGCATPPI